VDTALAASEEDSMQMPDPSRIHEADGGISILGFGGSLSPLPLQFSGNTYFCGSQVTAAQLCHVYMEQVDPILKILHRPSLSKWMLDGQPYLSYPQDHPSVRALGSAMCYIGACSMTESQCLGLFHVQKATLLADCQHMCEYMIERSGLLTTKDPTVLQAFVLYLVSTTLVSESNSENDTDVLTVCKEGRGSQ